MTAFSLRARWVLPVDGPAIDGGYVTVAGGRIASVGRSPVDGAAVEDLGDVVLMPGLVNAHTHLEFSDLSEPLGRPGMALPDWIRLVISERKRAGREPAEAVAAGLSESLAAGVTTIGEISTSPASLSPLGNDSATVVAFQESIGFSSQRADSALADVRDRFERTPSPAGLSPHAPYTVHPRLLEGIVRLAADRGAAVAMHLAESREELRLLAEGDGEFRALLEERGMWDAEAIPRGSRPLDYLQKLALAPRGLVIHGNYLASDEIEFLGKHRDVLSAVYCPRTHAFFGHKPYPLPAMLTAGVRVALGTDSRVSNPDLSLLAEVRLAARQFPQVEPATWVRMATADGAAALGLGDETGSLTPGKQADLIALPCGGAEPHNAFAYGEGKVARVWLRGREVTGLRLS